LEKTGEGGESHGTKGGENYQRNAKKDFTKDNHNDGDGRIEKK